MTGRVIAGAVLLALSTTGAGGGAGVASAAVPAQEAPVDELLARVQETYRGLRSMSARFLQRMETRPGMPPRVASGTWQMRAPGRMRVEYDESGRVLVADGDRLYWYLPADRQVHIRSQDEFAQRGNALLYLSGQGDLREDFAVSGVEWRTKLAAGNIQLRLDPLVPDTDYAHLLLEVEPDSAMIVRLVSFGLFSEPNEFRFTDIQIDTDLADELFRFTIPPGVDVETLGS